MFVTADLPISDAVLLCIFDVIRRFYRSGAVARSLTDVVAAGIKKLDPAEAAD